MTAPTNAPTLVRRRRRRREVSLAYLLVLPSLLVFALFAFYPLVRTFQEGFYLVSPQGERIRFIGFEQYRNVLTSETFRNSMWVTAKFVLITVPGGLILGVALALLAHRQLKGIAIFRTVFSSTVATSVAVASVMWLTLIGPQFGLLNYWLGREGAEAIDLLQDPNTALYAVALSTIWQNLGAVFIIMLAGLQAVPDDLLEAARIDGAGSWARFRYITLPMLSPVLLFASVILTLNAFQAFGQIDLLTPGGGPLKSTNVIVYDIYDKAFRGGSSDVGVASATAGLLFLILLALTLLQFRFLERRVFYGN
ncbi:MAG TPA: sugar ABC transporter permease [Acidimicrobiia bacterium]|nr:sugar ABC transporter permease [Acidimicrobiia bacterium]